jgi:hypothetical protein
MDGSCHGLESELFQAAAIAAHTTIDDALCNDGSGEESTAAEGPKLALKALNLDLAQFSMVKMSVHLLSSMVRIRTPLQLYSVLIVRPKGF